MDNESMRDCRERAAVLDAIQGAADYFAEFNPRGVGLPSQNPSEISYGPGSMSGDVHKIGDMYFAAPENDTSEATLEWVVDTPKQAVKLDSGKLRMDLMPPDALEALARVMTDGAVKYGCRNWELGMEWSRPYAALQRHLLAWWGGQDTDPESGHSHLWHVLTNAAFLTAYERRGIGQDDRPGKVEVQG